MTLSIVSDAIRQGLQPPPRLTLSQWADERRILSSESSAEPGPWRTDRAPYQRGIMDAISDPQIEEIVFKKCARVGFTAIIDNAIGYFIDYDPAPIMVIQPTVKDAEDWSKEELEPMLRDTPCLKGKVSEKRSRDANNTILHKKFPGGFITAMGANAPSGFRRRSIRVVIFDELDAAPASAGNEGDPFELARKRTTTFWNRKVITGSTPTLKSTSRIEVEYAESDQRSYHVPCPVCQHYQVLQWKNLTWPEAQPELAYYQCEQCESHLTEGDKHEMLRHGRWVAAFPERKKVGFHINELYSPWKTWARMAIDFLKAKNSPEKLQVWVNTSLGEAWEEQQGEQINAEGLLARRETYPAPVPLGALVLTCGVDVQGDRLEATVHGWGLGEEAWVIEHKILRGDPSQEEVWAELDTYLKTDFEHESGLLMNIKTTCIDTGGHHTKQVYAFCLGKEKRRIWGVKGSNQRGKPLVGRPSKNNRWKIPIWILGTDTGKDWLYAHLKIEQPGRGYIHLPDTVDEEFCLQLTAEKLVMRIQKGVRVREYIKPPGARNEALDIFVYSLAAFQILNPNLEAIAAKLAAEIERLKQQPAPPKPDGVHGPDSHQPRRAPKRAAGWLNSWRK